MHHDSGLHTMCAIHDLAMHEVELGTERYLASLPCPVNAPDELKVQRLLEDVDEPAGPRFSATRAPSRQARAMDEVDTVIPSTAMALAKACVDNHPSSVLSGSATSDPSLRRRIRSPGRSGCHPYLYERSVGTGCAAYCSRRTSPSAQRWKEGATTPSEPLPIGNFDERYARGICVRVRAGGVGVPPSPLPRRQASRSRRQNKSTGGCPRSTARAGGA